MQLTLFDAPELQEQRWRIHADAEIYKIRQRMAWHRQHMARLSERLKTISNNPNEV